MPLQWFIEDRPKCADFFCGRRDELLKIHWFNDVGIDSQLVGVNQVRLLVEVVSGLFSSTMFDADDLALPKNGDDVR